MSTPTRGTSCGKSKGVKDKRAKSGQPAPGTPRGRPSKESLFISAVANTCSVHQQVVETVLRAVETVAGMQLFNLVVDSDETAAILLTELQRLNAGLVATTTTAAAQRPWHGGHGLDPRHG